MATVKRVIYAEDLKEAIEQLTWYSARDGVLYPGATMFTGLFKARHIFAAIENAPTVDVVEVVHGRWIWKDGNCFCSACSKQGEPKNIHQDGTVDEHPYCPNCGATMDDDGNG